MPVWSAHAGGNQNAGNRSAEHAHAADRFAREIVRFLTVRMARSRRLMGKPLDGRPSLSILWTCLYSSCVTLLLSAIRRTQTKTVEREAMMRSAVIILENDHVALIERVRDGQTYYVFPGGTIEEGETAQTAAIREAYEELGVRVELHTLAAVVRFQNGDQYYYHATISAGKFGMGTGEELSSDSSSARGSYRPMWLARWDLTCFDVRPHALAQVLGAGTLSSMLRPLRIDEAR